MKKIVFMHSPSTTAKARSSLNLRFSEHGRNIADVAGRFSFWILLAPISLAIWIGTQTDHPLWQYTRKPLQEQIGPGILAVAVLCAVGYWAVERGFYQRWLVLLTSCLLCREIHFWGTSNGAYIGIPLLFWYASSHMSAMRPHVDRRLICTLFVGGFFTYVAAITVDRAVWKFLPQHRLWRDNVEETLESLGHLMILGMVIASMFRKRSSTATTPE